ncbi:hypothetical protein GUY61_35550, partial [Streptomyces sp. GC420]|nr:hypothetical protein [Streptomyces sp. GC420]
MTARETAAAVALIARYLDEDVPADDPAALVRAVLEAEVLIAPGGVCLRDTGAGTTVPTGWCFGLENWRDWGELAEGGLPRLGHDPAPLVEHGDGWFRLCDGRGASVEVPYGEVAGLLRGAQ